MDAAGGMGNKTRTGMLLGTPAYMSPEQVKSAKDVDARADLWSAGVMFYEMLTGRVAFPAPTEYARLTAVLMSEPTPIEQVDPQLLPLAAFVKKSLEKDRDLRFNSALDMSRALSAASNLPEWGGGRRLAGDAISRLPEVASLFAPNVNVPIAPKLPNSFGSFAAGDPSEAGQAPAKSPSGTLASQHAEPAPQVIVVAGGQASGETLPSQDLPMLPARSSGTPAKAPAPGRRIPLIAVVALVIMAFVAGILIGITIGRSR